MPVRTNPETCLHNVVAAGIKKNCDPYNYCCSCDTEITEEMWDAKNYVYDIDFAVWVHVSKRGQQAAEALKLVAQWEADPDVPSYVIAEFKNFVGPLFRLDI